MPKQSDGKKVISLFAPSELVRQIEQQATAERWSVSQTLLMIVEKGLEVRAQV